jgi:CrcB protein
MDLARSTSTEPPVADRSCERWRRAVTADRRPRPRPHHQPVDELPIDPDVDVGAAPRRSRRAEPRVLVAIAVGAMAGATARYELARWISVPAGGFPWATFWTNVSGAFVLGALLAVLVERYPPARFARAFAGTGFLGAYTTFSTFSVETDVLLKDGHFVTASGYVVASLAVGLSAAWLGITAGRAVATTARVERTRP